MGAELLALGALGIEALEHGVELALGQPRPLILDGDPDERSFAPCPEGDGTIGRAEGDGVVDQVAEDLHQTPLDSGNLQFLLIGEPQFEARTLLVRCREMDVPKGLEHAPEIDRLGLGARQLGVEPRCLGDVADQPVEAINVVENDGHQAPLLLRLLHPGHGLDGAAHAGQGILDLMGDVGGEFFHRVHALPQGVGHVPKRFGEIADLVPTVREIRDGDLAALAVAHPFGGVGETLHRAGDGAGEIERKPDRDDEDDGEHLEDVEAQFAQLLFDGGVRFGQHQDAQHLLVALNRYRHGKHQARVRNRAHGAAGLAGKGHQRLLIVAGPLLQFLAVVWVALAPRQNLDHPLINAGDEPGDAAAELGRRQFLDPDRAPRPGEGAAVGDEIAVVGEQARAQLGRAGETAHHRPRETG